MNEPSVVRKFFAVVFGVMFVCLLIGLIATLFGFGDLDVSANWNRVSHYCDNL